MCEEIEITPEMIAAGAKALYTNQTELTAYFDKEDAEIYAERIIRFALRERARASSAKKVGMTDRPAFEDEKELLSIAEIERLRAAGFVIVPLRPSDEMLRIGAPMCFQADIGHDPQTWSTAMRDARECYQVMIELGCL